MRRSHLGEIAKLTEENRQLSKEVASLKRFKALRDRHNRQLHECTSRSIAKQKELDELQKKHDEMLHAAMVTLTRVTQERDELIADTAETKRLEEEFRLGCWQLGQESIARQEKQDNCSKKFSHGRGGLVGCSECGWQLV